MIGVEVTSLGRVEDELLDGTRQFVARTFQLDSRISRIGIDPSGLTEGRDDQVASHELMGRLQSCVPADGWQLLSLVGFDLYLPMLSFVFGHAQLDGPVAIVSLARLRQEFYGLHPDGPLLERRLDTEVAHELGHTMGLHHCTEPGCCMTLSTSIEEVDAKSPEFCRSCRVKLREWRIQRQGQTDMIHPGRD